MPLELANPLETSRLAVRAVEEADLPALMDVNGDEEVTRYLPYRAWRSLDDARAWFERMRGFGATGASLQLVVVDKSRAQAVGTALVFRYDAANLQAELGFVLARAYWRTGFMTEALAILLDKVFGDMGVRRLEAVADSRNTASCRLLRRLGFTREGVLRECWLEDGKPLDAEIYGLLAREWRR
jgi:RimJ/RimL family protein N-acetyltransferase